MKMRRGRRSSSVLASSLVRYVSIALFAVLLGSMLGSNVGFAGEIDGKLAMKLEAAGFGTPGAEAPRSGTPGAEAAGSGAVGAERVGADGFVRVMVRMEEQPFVSAAMGPEVTRFVLQEAARRTQAPVLEFLQLTRERGDVRAFTGFWLVNVVFAEVRAPVVAQLAKLPGVEFVYEDFTLSVPEDDIFPVGSPLDGDGKDPLGPGGGIPLGSGGEAEVARVSGGFGPEQAAGMEPLDVGPNLLRWDHVAAVFAPQVWELGFRGQGVTVAVIDTGVDVSHPELAGAMGGSGPYYEGYWAEFDGNGHMVPNSRPYDSATHGTHVSGTVAGRNLEYQIGVAPEVTLAHALVLSGTTGTFPQVLAGMQWVAEQGFDVINGSLGSNDIVPDMAVATDNLYAAGVVPVFANGNIRLDSVPPGAPGNTPSAIAVGGYDPNGNEGTYNRGDIIEYPGYEYDQFTRIKPDISAPGTEVLSTYPGGRWALSNGTSMASPHVAGVVALLLSAYPDLTIDQIKEILFASTGGHKAGHGWDDIPTKNTSFGWGRINALRALHLAGGPGGVSVPVEGTVTGDGLPIAGATVRFDGILTEGFITDEDGRYEGEVDEGMYHVRASAPGHLSDSRSVIVEDTGSVVRVDFELQPIYTGSVTGTVRSIQTWLGEPGPVAGAVVQLPELEIQQTTDGEGEFSFSSVPTGEWRLHIQHPEYVARQLTITVERDETTAVDIQLEPAGGVLSFRNTFDSGLERSQWALTDQSGAGGWTFTERRSVSEPFSAWNGDEGGDFPYPAEQAASMTTPPFTVLTQAPHFSFRMRADLWGPFHTLRVFIHDVDADESTLLYVFDDGEATGGGDGGSSDGWLQVYFNLSDYAGRLVTLQFLVESDELVRGENEGVFIDDVVVDNHEGVRLSRLAGTVATTRGQGIPFATVTVTEVGGSGLVLQTMANRYGRYEIALPGGTWRVRATKTGDYKATEETVYLHPGDWNSKLLRLEANTPLDAVDGLTATPGDGRVVLEWNASSDPDVREYNVYVATEADGGADGEADGESFRRIGWVPGDEASPKISVDELENGRTYRFRVAVMDRYGMEGAAAEVTGAPDGENGEDPGDPPVDPDDPEPTVTMFDVRPRSITRGGNVSLRAELGHTTDEDARLHVLVRAALAGDPVREWEFDDQALGAFEATVATVDEEGKSWAPNVYQFVLIVTDEAGNVVASNPINVALFAPLPSSLSFLLGNNPFRPGTESQRLEYAVPTEGHVHMAVYTLDGRRVRTLADGDHAAGTYVAYWDGRDDNGRPMLAGMYVLRVRFTDDDGSRVELMRHSVIVK